MKSSEVVSLVVAYATEKKFEIPGLTRDEAEAALKQIRSDYRTPHTLIEIPDKALFDPYHVTFAYINCAAQPNSSGGAAREPSKNR